MSLRSGGGAEGGAIASVNLDIQLRVREARLLKDLVEANAGGAVLPQIAVPISFIDLRK
jgi:hypothetical protein